MYKKFNVYFKSEDDAQGARSGLRKLHTQNIFIDHMPGEDASETYIPVMPTKTGSFSPAITPLASEDVGDIEASDDDAMSSDEPVTHLLQGEVVANEYEEALQIMRDAGGVFKSN